MHNLKLQHWHPANGNFVEGMCFEISKGQADTHTHTQRQLELYPGRYVRVVINIIIITFIIITIIIIIITCIIIPPCITLQGISEIASRDEITKDY